MKKVGFIGLGTMGGPMAENLLKGGYQVFAHDINPDLTSALSAKGATIVKNPAEAASRSEVAMTMLPDAPEVEAVYLGENGLLSGAHPGLILIDSSTIHPGATQQIGQAVFKAGLQMIDAPVGGSPVNAVAGNLIMLVGGEKSTMEACRDILETVGQQVLYCGPLGSGEATKLANNLVTMLLAGTVAEAYTLAQVAGVDLDNLIALQKINIPRVFKSMLDRFKANDYSPGFKTTLAHKDLRLVLQMANTYNVPVPLGSAAKELFQMAIARGYGELNTMSPRLLLEPKAD